jgi:hypothetical protein
MLVFIHTLTPFIHRTKTPERAQHEQVTGALGAFPNTRSIASALSNLAVVDEVLEADVVAEEVVLDAVVVADAVAVVVDAVAVADEVVVGGLLCGHMYVMGGRVMVRYGCGRAIDGAHRVAEMRLCRECYDRYHNEFPAVVEVDENSSSD